MQKCRYVKYTDRAAVVGCIVLLELQRFVFWCIFFLLQCVLILVRLTRPCILHPVTCLLTICLILTKQLRGTAVLTVLLLSLRTESRKRRCGSVSTWVVLTVGGHCLLWRCSWPTSLHCLTSSTATDRDCSTCLTSGAACCSAATHCPSSFRRAHRRPTLKHNWRSWKPCGVSWWRLFISRSSD